MLTVKRTAISRMRGSDYGTSRPVGVCSYPRRFCARSITGPMHFGMVVGMVAKVAYVSSKSGSCVSNVQRMADIVSVVEDVTAITSR